MNNSIALEALLFIWSGGLSTEEIAKMVRMTTSQTTKALEELQRKYSPDTSGIVLSRYGNTWLLETNASCFSLIQSAIGEENPKNLSQQAMEVLSIIAYRQPVTRVEVEAIRGVRSSSVFDTLLARELIREAGRKDTVGKPYLYETTDTFLRVFSLSSLEELPAMPSERETPCD